MSLLLGHGEKEGWIGPGGLLGETRKTAMIWMRGGGLGKGFERWTLPLRKEIGKRERGDSGGLFG